MSDSKKSMVDNLIHIGTLGSTVVSGNTREYSTPTTEEILAASKRMMEVVERRIMEREIQIANLVYCHQHGLLDFGMTTPLPERPLYNDAISHLICCRGVELPLITQPRFLTADCDPGELLEEIRVLKKEIDEEHKG